MTQWSIYKNSGAVIRTFYDTKSDTSVDLTICSRSNDTVDACDNFTLLQIVLKLVVYSFCYRFTILFTTQPPLLAAPDSVASPLIRKPEHSISTHELNLKRHEAAKRRNKCSSCLHEKTTHYPGCRTRYTRSEQLTTRGFQLSNKWRTIIQHKRERCMYVLHSGYVDPERW